MTKWCVVAAMWIVLRLQTHLPDAEFAEAFIVAQDGDLIGHCSTDTHPILNLQNTHRHRWNTQWENENSLQHTRARLAAAYNFREVFLAPWFSVRFGAFIIGHPKRTSTTILVSITSTNTKIVSGLAEMTVLDWNTRCVVFLWPYKSLGSYIGRVISSRNHFFMIPCISLTTTLRLPLWGSFNETKRPIRNKRKDKYLCGHHPHARDVLYRDSV